MSISGSNADLTQFSTILGRGSNTLPTDKDVDGVIIGMSDFDKSNLLHVKKNIFTVSSGISAPKFSKFVGMEQFHSISDGHHQLSNGLSLAPLSGG